MNTYNSFNVMLDNKNTAANYNPPQTQYDCGGVNYV